VPAQRLDARLRAATAADTFHGRDDPPSGASPATGAAPATRCFTPRPTPASSTRVVNGRATIRIKPTKRALALLRQRHRLRVKIQMSLQGGGATTTLKKAVRVRQSAARRG
jgi:hypothetical protein